MCKFLDKLLSFSFNNFNNTKIFKMFQESCIIPKNWSQIENQHKFCKILHGGFSWCRYHIKFWFYTTHLQPQLSQTGFSTIRPFHMLYSAASLAMYLAARPNYKCRKTTTEGARNRARCLKNTQLGGLHGDGIATSLARRRTVCRSWRVSEKGVILSGYDTYHLSRSSGGPESSVTESNQSKDESRAFSSQEVPPRCAWIRLPWGKRVPRFKLSVEMHSLKFLTHQRWVYYFSETLSC